MRFGCRYLTDPENVWGHNSWDDHALDSEEIARADQVIKEHEEHALSGRAQIPTRPPSVFWDKFYLRNDRNFFKDRHWFEIEFSELFFSNQNDEPFSILEAGCGAGNSIFPILEGTSNTRPNLSITGIDFSPRAIQLVHTDPRYKEFEKRCTAFVFDLADPATTLTDNIPPGSVDLVLLVYVMSAIGPESMHLAISKITRILKPGGIVFFRDYGQYDLAQLRFRPQNCLQPSQYQRSDGTLSFFFTLDRVRSLFSPEVYKEIQLGQDRRLLVNRKRRLQMHRIWIQARFQKL